MSIDDRLREINQLNDGWNGEGSVAPPAGLIKWFSAHFVRCAQGRRKCVQEPRVYPTNEGGLSVEWSFGFWEVSTEIHRSNSYSTTHVMNMETDSSGQFLNFMRTDEGWNDWIEMVELFSSI